MMSRNRRKSVKRGLAALLFCLVLSITMVCLADEKGTVKVESAKIREKADTSSNQLGSVAKGGTVDIIGETTGADGQKWYQIYVDANTKGYLRADLVDRSGSSSLPTVDASTSSNSNANTSTDTGTSVEVTPIEPKVGTVKSNSVNVRKSTSTDSASIATVRKGVVLTVTGEATGSDSKKWYQVNFKYNDKTVEGFIRADLVTFENVPADAAVSSEITGTENAQGQTQPEPETRQEEPEQQPEPENNSDSDANENVIFMNVEEVPYIMPGFEYVKLDWNGQKINAYRNGTFFIVYAQKQNGEEGWYILDKEMNVYQRYPYTTENVTVPETGILGESPILLIVVAVVAVILVIVIIVLLVRLKGNDGYYEEYDDDDDYPEEDDEIEDLDEEIEDEPIRRPIPKKPTPQPARRPAPQGGVPQGQGGQPPRRPVPQGQGGQPARRPAPQGTAPQGQGGQPPRRPVPQGQGGQPPRRPAPQGGAPQGQRRPNPQNRPAQNTAPQRGQKAKPFLDNEDDDMDFIDI